MRRLIVQAARCGDEEPTRRRRGHVDGRQLRRPGEHDRREADGGAGAQPVGDRSGPGDEAERDDADEHRRHRSAPARKVDRAGARAGQGGVGGAGPGIRRSLPRRRRARREEKGVAPGADPAEAVPAARGRRGRDPPSDRFEALASLRSLTSPVGARRLRRAIPFLLMFGPGPPQERGASRPPAPVVEDWIGRVLGGRTRSPPAPHPRCRCGEEDNGPTEPAGQEVFSVVPRVSWPSTGRAQFSTAPSTGQPTCACEQVFVILWLGWGST